MLRVGQVVTLSDDKEYIVINKMSLHNLYYVYLITNKKPLEILIATEKLVDGNVVLEEVKDNDELDYILSQFVLDTNDTNKID